MLFAFCFLVEDNALLPWNTHLSMPEGLDRTVQGKLLGMVSAGRAVFVCSPKANMELCNNSRQTTKMNFLTNVRFVSPLMITHTRRVTTTTTITITKQDEGDTYRN